MKYLKLKKTSPEEERKKKENERRNKSRLEREATNKIQRSSFVLGSTESCILLPRSKLKDVVLKPQNSQR